MSAHPTLRERIGGRWALSWQGYLILLPISTIFILTTTPAFDGAANLLSGLAISLIAYAATGAVQWLAAVTVLRHRVIRPVPVWSVVLVGGVSWAVRSAVLWWALELLDLDSLAGITERLLFGFALGALVVPLTAAGLGNVARFREQREALLRELVDTEVAADRDRAFVEAMQLGLIVQVTRAVGSARQRMDEIDLSSESMPQEAIDALEIASEEGVRRVSRETWQEGELAARLRVRDLVRAAAKGRPFSLWGVALVSAFGFLLLLRTQTPVNAVLIPLIGAAYLAIVVLVVNAIARRIEPSVTLYVLGLLALSLSGPLIPLVVQWWGFADPLGTPAPLLTSSAALIVIPWTGAVRAFGSTEEQALDALHASIGEAQVRSETAAEQERRLRRQISTQLHGTVGANLTAATMRLRKAIDAGDKTRAMNALFEARRILDTDLSAVLMADAGDLEPALRDLAESWAGLVDVDVTVDVGDVASTTVSSVVDVVTEAINNAVRHGGARHVEVDVTRDGDAVVVVVEDDGRGAEPSRPGVGSRVFDQLAPGAWSRERRPEGGCRLEVRIGG